MTATIATQAAKIEALTKAVRAAYDFLQTHEEALYGVGHDIPMAAGATLLHRELFAALAAVGEK